MTTEHKPVRVMIIGAGVSAASALAIFEAARAIETVAPEVEPEPHPMRLPILRGDELPFMCNVGTGKQKAQWKQETNGKKRK